MTDDLNILLGLQSSYERAELEPPPIPELPMPGIKYQVNDPHRPPLEPAARIKPYPRWQNPAGNTGLHPFKLVGTENDNEVRVVAGTVNGMLPDGFNMGDDPPFILSISPPGVVYVQVGIDADDVVNQVSVETAGTMPGDTDTTFNNLIGTFAINDDGDLVFSNTVTTSLWWALCGGVNSQWGTA